MGGDVMGGGVVWAIAAALWILYFIPTWMRRRRYMASERNAVRLQQTLRILAETAEVPHEVRMEATAKQVVVQQRLLKVSEDKKRAEEKAQAMELARAEKAAREALREAGASAKRSMRAAGAGRRALLVRRIAAGLGAVGLIVVVVGLVALPFGGSGVIALSGLIGLVAGLGALVALAPGRRRAASGASQEIDAAGTRSASRSTSRAVVFDADIEEPSAVEADDESAQDVSADQVTWTPRPVPKPLYLSRGSVAASAMASVDAVEKLRAASLEAENARRAAEQAIAAGATPIRRAPGAGRPGAGASASVGSPESTQSSSESSAVSSSSTSTSSVASTSSGESRTSSSESPRPSRFASMGVIDGVDAIDLDEALQRRRGA